MACSVQTQEDVAFIACEIDWDPILNHLFRIEKLVPLSLVIVDLCLLLRGLILLLR